MTIESQAASADLEGGELTTRELATSLALARATLEATADGVIATNPAGLVTMFNERCLEMWGLDRAALESRQFREVLPIVARKFANPDAFLARVDAIYASSDVETLDSLELLDGRVIERYSRKQTIDGREVGRVWSFRDVTERVRAQAALKEAQAQLKSVNETLEATIMERTAALQRTQVQFQQLVNGVSDCAIFLVDPAGKVVSWNPGAERIKGYSAQEIIGRHFSTFYTEEDREAGKPAHALAIAAREGKYEAEGWRVRKDGTRFLASVLIDAIRTEDGTLVGFAKITRDMTERRAMQEQLHQAQKMEAVGQLTGGVAHDFNNLLTVILGNLDTLWRQTPPTDARLRRAIEQATRGAQRAATLTQQLLAFSRRQPLNPKPTDVNRLVTGMSELIRRAMNETIAVETVLAPGVWRVEVDPHQLESALLNLAVNARDAMPDGGRLTLETANTTLDEGYAKRHAEINPGPYVLICVSDTGQGMTSEVLAHAFDPFFTTKPLGQGTGLGLSQVFGFVKQSGGHVKLYSQAGHGTTVKIYLPRMLGDAPVHAPHPASIEPARGANETILVVEDDEDVRSYSTETLRELGFTVLEAHDGATALRLLERHPEVQLLFTDVGLPDLNGRQLVEEARRRRPRLPVLFTSGYALNVVVHQGRLDAGVDLLTKPFSRAQLAARIRDALEGRPVAAHERVALVIEDEPLVRMFVTDVLEELGFSVVQSAAGKEGLAAIERLASLEVAIVDVGLPDRNGADVASELRARRPALPIVIASGYHEPERWGLRDQPRIAFLKKPFDEAAIREALQSLEVPLGRSG